MTTASPRRDNSGHELRDSPHRTSGYLARDSQSREAKTPNASYRRRPQNDSATSPLLSKLQSTHHQQESLHNAHSTVAGGSPIGNTTQSAGGASKMRMLEDFIERYPTQHPPPEGESAGGLKLTGDNAGDGSRAVHRATAAEREMRRMERENATRRTRTENARATFENARKQRIEQWITLAERNNRKLRKENDALARVAQLTQENCINNDARYDETVNSLRAELEYTTLYRQDSAETLNYVWEAVGSIQDRIVHLKTTGERQAQADFTKMKKELEELLDQRTQELEQVRQYGSNTTGEWVEKNKTLQEEVERLLYKTDDAYAKNKELLTAHKQLQVEHDAQVDDGRVLEKQFHQASLHHQRLKDRIHDLELELVGIDEASGTRSPMQDEDDDALKRITDVSKGMSATQSRAEQSATYASSLRREEA